MNWKEEQRKKLFQDYSSGKITNEQFNEMSDALDKPSGKKQGELVNISRIIILFLVIIFAYFVIGGIFNYFFIKNVFGRNDKQSANTQTRLAERSDNAFLSIC